MRGCNMAKAAEAFRTISEVADDLGIPKHVLRFWEVKFVQIRPMKRGGGRRYYRPEDMELLKGIQHLLHREGYTIKGVQKILREQGIEAVKAYSGPGAASGRSRDSGPGAGAAPAAVSPPSPGEARAGRAAAEESMRLLSVASRAPNEQRATKEQRAPNEQQKPAPSAAMDRDQERLIAAALVELQACRALLHGERVRASAVIRRSRASGSR